MGCTLSLKSEVRFESCTERMMKIKNGTECVLCGGVGVLTRFVKKVGYHAWVCHNHRSKD
jgi:hypothetical protein